MYIGLGGTSLRLVASCSCYLHLSFAADVTNGRERNEVPSLCGLRKLCVLVES
jgi:hypothetical protein